MGFHLFFIILSLVFAVAVLKFNIDNLVSMTAYMLLGVVLSTLISKKKSKSTILIVLGVAFALMYLAYGLYFHFYEYRTNYRQFQKHLEQAVDKGLTIYPEETITYDFQDSSVYMEYDGGMKRYFLYEDIRYFEETDRFYLFGMKYRPKENRLTGFERALFPKRDLDPEIEERLLQVMANVVEAYDLRPVL